jgi:murein DD-endopeptidase MepM/ murein hydrolase activator NlpD
MKTIFQLSLPVRTACLLLVATLAADFASCQVNKSNEDGRGGMAIPLTSSTTISEAEKSAALGSVNYTTPPLLFSTYVVKQGDNLWTLCRDDFGLNRGTIYSVNGITKAKMLRVGEVLRIPNQDGLYYTVKQGDTLYSIANNFNTRGGGDVVKEEDIVNANQLFTSAIRPGEQLFIPGATMDDMRQREITGDLFYWPVPSHYITSPYGRRRDPFTNRGWEFHTGIDIRAPMGTPVCAPMAGTVIETGNAAGGSDRDRIFGNYIIIRHNSEYTTLYGHLSQILVRPGQRVTVGTVIGKSGDTGEATGPHLHFTVYKYGSIVNPTFLMAAKSAEQVKY